MLANEFTLGGIGRIDLSFDGKRIVFPFARKRKNGTSFNTISEGGSGLCDKYDIFEVNTDGTDLQQVTNSLASEDTEPCYLPNGRIAFTSSRDNRFVQCGDWALVNGIYTIDPKNKDLRKVTEPQDGEFYPSLLEDGRIMYTRWDYVMKPYNTQQQLWGVNPDGRRAELIYGDYYKFTHGPIALFESRQIPGSSKVIAVGAAHHNNSAGPIMIVDLHQNRGTAKGMVKVTPEVHYPEVKLEGKSGRSSTNSSPTGWYSSPYPISEKHFLVSYTLDSNSGGKYGLYLMDVHGNKELIYAFGDNMSCYSAIPIRPRKRPPVIPDMVHGVPHDKEATLIVSDIYQGLFREGVKRGEVKYMRIIEVLPKTIHTNPRRMDVGLNSGWDIRKVIGTVPVEIDGSVHFKLPPHRLFLFEALDKDYLEIKRMRNYINVKPGEVVSCIGCHEPYGTAPLNMGKIPIATTRPASTIIPPPWQDHGMDYQKMVQPVLDKNCISCHDGTKEKDKSFNLIGKKLVATPNQYGGYDEGPTHLVSESFLNLLKYITYSKVGEYGDHDRTVLYPTLANTVGSRSSSLMKTLAKGHHNVKLNMPEWRVLAAWIDCNAPYYGDFKDLKTVDDLRKQELKAGVPKRKADLEHKFKNMNIISYLDSGVITTSLNSGKETIAEETGEHWFIRGDQYQNIVPVSTLSLTFDPKLVTYKLSKLQKTEQYHLGLTWWQTTNDGRAQTITVKVPGTNLSTELLPPTVLPNYDKNKQKESTLLLRIPPEFTQYSEIIVEVKGTTGVNVILSEFFLATAKGTPQASLMKGSSFIVADLRDGEVKTIDTGGKIKSKFKLGNALDVSLNPTGSILASGVNGLKLIDKNGKERLSLGGQIFSARFMSGSRLLINKPLQKLVEVRDFEGNLLKTISTKIAKSPVSPNYHALHLAIGKNNTFWIAHRHNNCVKQYDLNGKVIRTISTGMSTTSVTELENGHVLIASGKQGTVGGKTTDQGKLIEVNQNNNIVWILTANEIPEINLKTPCGFKKLANGNLVITNWTGHNFEGKYTPIFEITPRKEVVWTFSNLEITPEPIAIEILPAH